MYPSLRTTSAMGTIQNGVRYNTGIRIYYLLDYISCSSARYYEYETTSEERDDRSSIWDFKDGYCHRRVLDGLVNAVRSKSDSQTLVCFVPASTKEKTQRRYSRVAEAIQRLTGVPCSLNAIKREEDGQPGHQGIKKDDPSEDYTFDRSLIAGKKIILIDDVITRGNTLRCTARRLKENGAINVIGLAVGATVNLSGRVDTRNLEKLSCD